MRDFGHTVSKGSKTLRVQLRHADAHRASGIHVLRQPPARWPTTTSSATSRTGCASAFDLTGTPIILKFRKKD